MIQPKSYQAKITKNLILTPRVHQIEIEMVEPKTIEFIAGQFLMFEIQITDNREQKTNTVKRAYSIASPPSQNDKIELLIDIAPGGPASQYFSSLKEGTVCTFMAPYGQFTLRDTANDKIFIAGSTGVAPMRSMILDYFFRCQVSGVRFQNMSLYFGVNKTEEMFLREEISALEFENTNFHFIPVVAEPEAGGGWNGEKGLVTDPLFREFEGSGGFKGFEGKDFYLCGSPAMVPAVKQQLLDKGVNQENIFNEKF